jgi:hypothetical protein
MPNRLAHATSPYLLQHKDNPVDWWEWGPEAFEEARARNVPVLLSVGYAACHWCHMMALSRDWQLDSRVQARLSVISGRIGALRDAVGHRFRDCLYHFFVSPRRSGATPILPPDRCQRHRC